MHLSWKYHYISVTVSLQLLWILDIGLIPYAQINALIRHGVILPTPKRRTSPVEAFVVVNYVFSIRGPFCSDTDT